MIKIMCVKMVIKCVFVLYVKLNVVMIVNRFNHILNRNILGVDWFLIYLLVDSFLLSKGKPLLYHRFMLIPLVLVGNQQRLVISFILILLLITKLEQVY